jgi:hypothetical protein
LSTGSGAITSILAKFARPRHAPSAWRAPPTRCGRDPTVRRSASQRRRGPAVAIAIADAAIWRPRRTGGLCAAQQVFQPLMHGLPAHRRVRRMEDRKVRIPLVTLALVRQTRMPSNRVFSTSLPALISNAGVSLESRALRHSSRRRLSPWFAAFIVSVTMAFDARSGRRLP